MDSTELTLGRPAYLLENKMSELAFEIYKSFTENRAAVFCDFRLHLEDSAWPEGSQAWQIW